MSWPRFILLGALIAGCDAPTPVDARVDRILLAKDENPSALEYHEVDELSPTQRGKVVRVHGWVQPGSIAQRHQPLGLRFVLVRGEGELTVELSGPIPERFQERLEAIVSGTLSEDGTRLQADEVVSKCPDNYDTLPTWPERGGPR